MELGSCRGMQFADILNIRPEHCAQILNTAENTITRPHAGGAVKMDVRAISVNGGSRLRYVGRRRMWNRAERRRGWRELFLRQKMYGVSGFSKSKFHTQGKQFAFKIRLAIGNYAFWNKTKSQWADLFLFLSSGGADMGGTGPSFFLLGVTCLPTMDDGRRRVRSLEY